MSAGLTFLVIMMIGAVIALILWVLAIESPVLEESPGEGIPEKIQAFVDDIVQQIRDLQVTDKLREFWKNAERTFQEWRGETGGQTPRERSERQVPGVGSLGGKRGHQTSKVTTKRARRCFTCGAPTPDGQFCANCGAEHRICPVCKKGVWHGENVIECPMCGSVAHTPHILEWLRVKGTCPTCREKLVLS